MSILDLVRTDLRDFAGYRSARSECLDGTIWLNANESPWANDTDPAQQLRRYPEPQPERLCEALAALYGCRPSQLLVSRGSDEGIDVLIRAVCQPGSDAILVTPPTFGMYAVGARLHGTRVVEVPLVDGERGYACDFEAVAAAAERQAAKIVFLCSPGNPGGNLLPLREIAALAQRLQDRALVVVDEAYIEFAGVPSAIGLLDTCDNIAILRTLSKAHALAAARVGCLIADAALIAVLRRCQAPYPLPEPSARAALAAVSDHARTITQGRVLQIIEERERMQAALATMHGVRRLRPSDANFLLVHLDDAQKVFDRLLGAGIVVRDLRAMPGLDDALRITVGTPEQNDRVLAVLAGRVIAGEVAA